LATKVGGTVLIDFELKSKFRSLSLKPFDRENQHSTGLGKRTILYGRNGSGKSTFSEFLRLATSPKTPGAKAHYWNTNIVMGVLPQRPLDRIHVFNRFYITETLEEFLNAAGNSPPIVKLGSKSIELENDLRTAQQFVDSRTQIVNEAEKFRNSATQRLEKARDNAKTSVIKELDTVDNGRFNKTVYRTDKAEIVLKQTPWSALDQSELQNSRELARSQSFTAHSEVNIPLGALKVLSEQVEEACTRAISNSVIERLSTNAEVATWVESGIKLHQAGQTCQFCDIGVVTEVLLDKYAGHFNDALLSLRADLESIDHRLEIASKTCEQWMSTFPMEQSLLPDSRTAFCAARDDLKLPVQKIQTELDALKNRINERSKDILVALAGRESVDDSSGISIGLEALNTAIRGHNKACANQADSKKAAILALERDAICPFREDYQLASSQIDSTNKVLARATESLAHWQQSAAELESARENTREMAEQLDADLKTYFGYTHLSISVSQDDAGYKVSRNSKPADNLSEGERNCIALLFFLRSLEATDISLNDDLVVIDDPVSSLDRENLFAVHSLIEARTENIGQLILLTHDFEFFRLSRTAWNSKYRDSRKAIKDDNQSEKCFPRVKFLEIFSRINLISLERETAVRELSTKLLDHLSEYHYLFWRVALAVQTPNDPELPLLGNAGRRLLEGFISFKEPAGDSFQTKISATAKEAGVPTEQTQRILRFAHAMSHRDEPSVMSALEFPSMKEELEYLLDFIKDCDQKHFDKMCLATHVGVAAR